MLVMVGCGETSPETLIDELRVIASVAEPPEVQPGATFDFTSYVANPDDRVGAMATWVCTNLGEGCIEAAGGTVSLASAALEGEAQVWTRTLDLASALAPVVAEGPVTATQVWTMACRQDTCPVLDAIASLSPTDPWPEELRNDLANPTTWMADLPMADVSLAYQLLTASFSDEPHQNPTLTPAADMPTSLARDQTFSLPFTVDGDFAEQAQVYGSITGGGFKMPSTYVEAGDTITLEGTAPKDAEEARIWVTLVDGQGGVAVWTESLPVE